MKAIIKSHPINHLSAISHQPSAISHQPSQAELRQNLKQVQNILARRFGVLESIFVVASLFMASPGTALAATVDPATCIPSTFASLASPVGTLVLDSVAIQAAAGTLPATISIVNGVATPTNPNLEFCRVKAHIHTYYSHAVGETDKEIQIELRLPTTSNGKYLQYGGGGYDGAIGLVPPNSTQFVPLNGFAVSLFNTNVPTYSLGTYSPTSPPPTTLPLPVQPLNRGYTIAATDGGHVGSIPDASFLGTLASPIASAQDRWLNFTMQSRHLLAVTAKTAMAIYYGQPPSFSYHSGFSTGGQAGLVEANLYPNDFDGVLALSPTLGSLTRNSTSFIRVMQKQFLNPNDLSTPTIPFSSATVVSPLLMALGSATMAKCDPQDGLSDGVISDPENCDFNVDTDVPQCAGDIAGPTCFTSAQRAVLKSFYTPSVVNGVTVYPRFLPGYQGDPAPELPARLIGTASTPATSLPLVYQLADTTAKYLIFGDLTRNIWNIDLTNPSDANAFTADVSPAGFDLRFGVPSADLSAFKTTGGTHGTGGKIIVLHGFTNPQVSPLDTRDYYKTMAQAFGGLTNTRTFARLFLLPGIAHVGRPTAAGAYGPLDYFAPLEQWVENAIPPDTLPAADTQDATKTRPICAYPFKAVYNGSGSITNAASFTCKEDSHLAVTPTSITQTVFLGSQAAQNLTISNVPQAGGPSVGLNWTITEATTSCSAPSDVAWLSESTTSGVTPNETSSSVSVTLNSASLPVGSYSAKLCITGTNAYQNQLVEKFEVPVTLNVVYKFTGFLFAKPAPQFNDWIGGLPLPISFTLAGYQGKNVIAAGYPQSQPVSCSNGTTLSLPVEATTAAFPLVYLPIQQTSVYLYTANTKTAWNDTCRQFTVKLIDGTIHVGNVRFKKK